MPFFFRSPRQLCSFSSVHRTNCAILTVLSPHFLSIYCDFIEFNVANNETESKRNLSFFETENCFFFKRKITGANTAASDIYISTNNYAVNETATRKAKRREKGCRDKVFRNRKKHVKHTSTKECKHQINEHYVTST